jgi:hypothetical protein
MADKPIIWSYGGGTQSAAIAVLVARGELPRPERIVIADTGREATETWEYTDQVIGPLLGAAGLTVDVIPHEYATVDLYSKQGDLLIPAVTKGGRLPTFCSVEWKQRPVRRYLRSQGYGPSRPVIMWLGISIEEVHRIKPADVNWIEHQWPLAWDIRMNRADCVALVEGAGLPTPPRSSCWMCPHRSNAEWRRLRDHYSGDWDKAIALDEQIRQKDTRGGLWLHRQRVPLTAAGLNDENVGLFDGCESGYCWA